MIAHHVAAVVHLDVLLVPFGPELIEIETTVYRRVIRRKRCRRTCDCENQPRTAPAPAPRHQRPGTSAPAPAPRHQRPGTSAPAPAPRHQRPGTSAPAPAPPKLLPKTIYGTSVWTHLLVEKFHLQRPTHRTMEQLRLWGLRLWGLSLAPGTIADGLQRIEPLMAPLEEAMP